MNAGELRDQVTFQALTQSADTFGAAGSESWANIATTPIVWAALETLSGREFFAAQRVAAEVTHRIRIRYRSDITPKHRVKSGSGIFDILAVFEVDRRIETHLLVKERV